MLNGPFSPWPSFTQEESDAVCATLLSGKVNYWTGQECREFEREFAYFTDTSYAIALSNGTLALDLALQGLGIGAHYGGREEDEVIVTPRSFMASVSSIVNAGARPVFADVDADTQNITAASVKAVLSVNTKAVLCVHLAGWPCDMDAIKAVTTGNIKLIEDCAQAHGALYKGRPVGGLGDVAAWSFCQDKIMTTGGEGGMITCNDENLWRKMWAYKDHGKSYEAAYEREHAPGFRWLHESFGTNWRMTEIQGVLGRIQLKRMARWTQARAENAAVLTAALKPFSDIIRIPILHCADCMGREACSGCVHAWYKYYAFVRPEQLAKNWNRNRIINEINNLNVPCMQGTCSEIYLERAFDDTGLRPEQNLPVAKVLGDTSLMFLVHPTLTPSEMSKTAKAIRTVLSRAMEHSMAERG